MQPLFLTQRLGGGLRVRRLREQMPEEGRSQQAAPHQGQHLRDTVL